MPACEQGDAHGCCRGYPQHPRTCVREWSPIVDLRPAHTYRLADEMPELEAKRRQQCCPGACEQDKNAKSERDGVWKRVHNQRPDGEDTKAKNPTTMEIGPDPKHQWYDKQGAPSSRVSSPKKPDHDRKRQE